MGNHFIAGLRDELLNVGEFMSVAEPRLAAERWQRHKTKNAETANTRRFALTGVANKYAPHLLLAPPLKLAHLLSVVRDFYLAA
jgi:hypothetical protein